MPEAAYQQNANNGKCLLVNAGHGTPQFNENKIFSSGREAGIHIGIRNQVASPDQCVLIIANKMLLQSSNVLWTNHLTGILARDDIKDIILHAVATGGVKRVLWVISSFHYLWKGEPTLLGRWLIDNLRRSSQTNIISKDTKSWTMRWELIWNYALISIFFVL